VILLLITISIAEFVLNGIQNVRDGDPWMAGGWLTGAAVVAFATFRTEKYFTKRRRMGP
jgi:hypothetical protein